jgi:hypothetical protein
MKKVFTWVWEVMIEIGQLRAKSIKKGHYHYY